MTQHFPHHSKLNLMKNICYVAMLAVLATACQKNEIVKNITEGKSRLYVSNADTAALVANLDIYDRADASMPMVNTEVSTGAKDGNGVFADVKANMLYQVSRAKKTVYVFDNAASLRSTATPVSMFTDNTLSSAREIALDTRTKTLFIANNSDSSIRVYDNASGLNGDVVGRKLKIGGQPWGIHYDEANDRLLVLIDLDARRIDVFNNPGALPEGNVAPSASFVVSNLLNGTFSRLHGLTYSDKLDLLLVTEIGEAALPASPAPGKPAFNADGGILVFEGASQKLTTGGTFAASRTIYGDATMMGNPVDIAIDDTNDKLIYVAEKANRKILAFALTASGNVAPAISVVTSKLPEALFMDDTRTVTYKGNTYGNGN